MLQISEEFKQKVFEAVIEAAHDAKASGTSYKKFAIKNGIDNTVLTRMMNGERDRLLSDAKILELSRLFDVSNSERKWKTVETDVYRMIYEDILFCKSAAKLRCCADDCGIGKSFSSRHIAKQLDNVFYIDAKQSRTRSQLMKALARSIGIGASGNTVSVKEKVKFALKSIVKPLVVVDDVGYVDNECFLELFELIDATEYACGWYFIGDDSLQEKIERGINSKKIGYRAMFSRLGKSYTRPVPITNDDRKRFYKKLLTDVITANAYEGADIKEIVSRCLRSESNELIGDLRRAESLLILSADGTSCG